MAVEPENLKWLREHKIAEGGSAIIVQVAEAESKIKFAAKIPKGTRLRKVNSDYARQITTEIKYLKKLDHPHVVGYVTHFWIDDPDEKCLVPTNSMLFDFSVPVLIMDLSPGPSLWDKLQRKKRFPESEVISVAQQMLDALSYLQRLEIIHRDVKPANILEVSPGWYKLCDFGFAIKGEGKLSTTGVGTPYYLTPEMAVSAEYSFKSDIWSLGVSLYALLYDTMPFDGMDYISCIEAIKTIRYHFPAWLQAAVSDHARDFLTRIFKKNPRDRPTIAQAQKHPWVTIGCELALL